MSLESRIEKLESATACPACRLAVPVPADAAPDDYLIGTCELCGETVTYHVKGWSEREREVGAVLALRHFEETLTERRTMAMACWLERRTQAHETAERADLQARATFSAIARRRLALIEQCDALADARWSACLSTASDETLQAIVDVHSLTDAELERIIWPEPIAA